MKSNHFLENKERLVKDHIIDSESTMNTDTNASVGYALVKLEKKYFNHSTQSQKDAAIDRSIDQLTIDIESYCNSAHTEINRATKLKNAWKWITTVKLQEPLNTYDYITYFENNVECFTTFDLKKTIAVIYASLTDVTIFQQDAFTNKLPTETNDEAITHYLNDRKLSIFQEIIALHNLDVCHQGSRHDFATLLSLYPGIKIVSEINQFVSECFSTECEEVLNQIQKENKHAFMSVLLSLLEAPNSKNQFKFHELIEEKINRTRIYQHVYQKFLDVGLNPENNKYHAIIEGYLNYICNHDEDRGFFVPYKIVHVINNFKQLLTANISEEENQNRIATINLAKQAIYTISSLQNDTKTIELINRVSLIDRFYILYRSYLQTLALSQKTQHFDKTQVSLSTHFINFFKSYLQPITTLLKAQFSDRNELNELYQLTLIYYEKCASNKMLSEIQNEKWLTDLEQYSNALSDANITYKQNQTMIRV